MAQLIRMPSLSPTMEQGNLAKWHVQEGTEINAGDLIAEIETDKTTMEFEAVDPGVIGKILIPEGTPDVKVNEPIALLLEDGESISDDWKKLIESDSSPAPEAIEQEKKEELQNIEEEKTQQLQPQQNSQKSLTSSQTELPKKSKRIFASPLARRMAAEKNIDLNLINGSGPHGRIIKADIENAPSIQKQPATPMELPDVASQYQDREFIALPLDGMRRTVAARLSEANRTIPHFYLRRDIAIDNLLGFRANANKILEEDKIRLSINDFVIRACALALQKVPAANSVWAENQILQLKPSDVAVAVAVEGGLFTPVIRDAETKSVQQLSVEMKLLATKAKSRKLMPSEYTGGTFSISNLGMFGISSFDAVINPPHASILAVGAAQKRAVEKDDGSVAFSTFMPVTLSCDHRVLDGAAAAEFLAAISNKIENPLSMML